MIWKLIKTTLFQFQGLSETASNLVRVATEEHEKKGMTGAVGGVLRQIPPTVVKPLILATEATSNVLGGAMNQLQPDKREEALQKWKLNSSTEKKWLFDQGSCL